MNNMSVSYAQLLVALVILSGIAIYGNQKREATIAVQPVVAEKNMSGVKSRNENNLQEMSEKQSHQHHPRVKPGAAVNLKSVEPLFAAAPGIHQFQLTLVSPSHEGNMVVDVSASDGVTIVSPQHHFEFELHTEGEYPIPVTLSASAEGRFYIQLHVSIIADGQTSSRVIAAILQVGEPAAKAQKAAPQNATKSADTIISLPAQETISPR